MDAEVDGAMRNAVCGCSTQRADGQVQFVGDAVYHIAQQVETVNGKNLNAYGIEGVLRFLVVNGHDGVALLGCQSYGDGTITFVDGNRAIRFFETDNLLTEIGFSHLAK